jgi:hypothetical protein
MEHAREAKANVARDGSQQNKEWKEESRRLFDQHHR